MSRGPIFFALAIVTLSLLWAQPKPAADINELERQFQQPPPEARIMMRWWWFGTAVTKPELERELTRMKEGGIGGVEIQPVYPLTTDDPAQGRRNLPYLSDGFLDAVRFASDKAHEMGMRVDITLGSGWPFGGPHVPVNEAAGALRCVRVEIPADARSIAAPDIATGERLIAVFLASGDAKRFAPEGITRTTDIHDGRLTVPRELKGPHVALFFISSYTGQQVKRAAAGAEGFVLDHYNRAAIEHHLQTVGERVLGAFGPRPPYAVFSDSLEVFGSDWTPNFLEEFRKRRGYDLTPYLPALVGDIGEKTGAVRVDWGRTLAELADENYLTPIREWAHRHHTLFRSQTYGTPPVTLSSNALVDLGEGEEPHWRKFTSSRWASSANHLYGRPVTSSETWTWLHSPAFRATPLDMKAEADLHFLEGINQLIGHGWPYSPEYAGEPGWRFYAAAAFNDHNPWWIVMPDLTRYMQRVSFLLREGKPVNDVAVYLPTSDAQARFVAGTGTVSVNRGMSDVLDPEVVPQILNAGYAFDFIDDGAIEKTGIPYRVLLLPIVERAPLSVYRKIAEFARRGGIVIATGHAPSLAPGLLDGERDTDAVRTVTRELFGGDSAAGHLISNVAGLGAELTKRLTPDFAVDAPGAEIGFVHRQTTAGDIYFVANTMNRAVRTHAKVRLTGRHAEWWDPFTGRITAADTRADAHGVVVPLQLAAYESRVLVFTDRALPPAQPAVERKGDAIDLGSGWTVTFDALRRTVEMGKLRSWTRDPETLYYSGQATYERMVNITAAQLSGGAMELNFGEGIPVENQQHGPGMRAWLDSPVREAAVVYVNGQRAGSVWKPPFQIDIKPFLHAGENRIRIVAANTAMNTMAGKSSPDYRLLNLRYGVRFEPQDMKNLQPLPSGLVGPLRLICH